MSALRAIEELVLDGTDFSGLGEDKREELINNWLRENGKQTVSLTRAIFLTGFIFGAFLMSLSVLRSVCKACT